VVADQYRDGNVPAGMDTLPVAQRGFEVLPPSVTDRRFRGDSACYETKLLRWLWRQGIAFTVSADMTPDLRDVCRARSVSWQRLEERPHEFVDAADVEFTPGIWPKTAPPMRYAAMRFSSRQGVLFADGTDTKYLAVVSNRRELSLTDLVRWHWQKAGTIELLHDVTKNELAARLPPSGRFGANAAWYRLTMMTYNVLSALRCHALPERLARARPRRLRFEVFTAPARLRRHARQLVAQLGVPELTARELITARERLLALRETIHRAAAPRP
jgi:hypothetical protein